MDISALKNNPFMMMRGTQGVQKGLQTQGVTAPKKAGADGGNPFSNDMAYVGLGIKDGEHQTSAAQMGKKAMPMRQIGIA